MSTLRRLAPTAAALAVVLLLVLPAAAAPADKARTAAKAERWQEAADAWLEVLAKKPADREAALGLKLAATRGELVDLYLAAEEGLLAHLEKQSGDRDVRLALGDLFVAKARSKTDQQSMKFAFEDAKNQFQSLLDADAGDEDAAVGLARTYYWTAFFSDALMTLDEFLAKHQSKGPALFWKGQVRYLEAQDAYRKAGELNDDVKGLFAKAVEAYQGAAKAQPDDMDAWMQLGYAAQYLGETDVSQAAYEKAMDLDRESLLPLKGIEALYHYRQDEYAGALKALTRAHPLNRAVHFFLGFRQLFDKDYDDAVKSFERYASSSKEADRVWTFLAQAYDGTGNDAKARANFAKALTVNPADETAADALIMKVINEHGKTVYESPQGALDAVEAFGKVFELAPTNPLIRNNAAFLLRDALDKGHQADAAWLPVLDACIRLYEDASRICEDLVRDRENTIPYRRRYVYAGIFNDTGLMLMYYPARKDVEKAEEYVLRSLELTQDGYRDAWENLTKLYLDQQRWEEAYDLNRDCAESITLEDGSPHPHRSHAASVADKLVAEGKVAAD